MFSGKIHDRKDVKLTKLTKLNLKTKDTKNCGVHGDSNEIGDDNVNTEDNTGNETEDIQH